jgi:hypothetical protein
MGEDESSKPAPEVAAPDSRFTVGLLPNRVVRASAHVRVLHQDVAIPLCGCIQDAAREAQACGLVMDMAALSKATPAAGWYALRQLKSLPVGRIALVGGTAFMRVFARTVLTIGRFGEFAFFSDEPTAGAWAAEGCHSG